MLEVHLYGRLRRFAALARPTDDSVVEVAVVEGDTIGTVLGRLGIELGETSNIFLNGELSAPKRMVSDGGRLGVFPPDQAVLYKWYFATEE